MAFAVPSPRDASRIHPAGAIAAIALTGAIVAIYWSDAAALWGRWSESGPSNLMLFVGPLLPWLIWRQRAAVVFDPRPPLGRAAIVLAALGLGWALASAAHVDIVRQAFLPAMAWAAIWGLIGTHAARAALFPLAWTGCAVMAWEWLTPALQAATAKAAPVLVGMVGIPAHIEGNFVSVPAGTFEVAAGCSGLSFFMVAVTLALLNGHLREWPVRTRLAFLVLAASVAVAFNWIRVAIIISVGQLSEMQSSLVRHHVLFGWCLYAVALIALFLIAARWDTRAPQRRATARPDAIPNSVGLARRAAIVLALLAFPPVLAALQQKRVDAALAGTGVELPAASADWEGPVDQPFDWRPLYPGASAVARGIYRGGGATIGVDISYFSRQQSGMKLIASTSRPGGGDDWQLIDAREVRSNDSAGGPPLVSQMHLHARDDGDWLVWQWYQIGATATPSAPRAKLAEGLRAFGATSASASVSVAIKCHDDCGRDDAAVALSKFVASDGHALAVAASGRSASPNPPRSAAR